MKYIQDYEVNSDRPVEKMHREAQHTIKDCFQPTPSLKKGAILLQVRYFNAELVQDNRAKEEMPTRRFGICERNYSKRKQHITRRPKDHLRRMELHPHQLLLLRQNDKLKLELKQMAMKTKTPKPREGEF